jgi:hypothetical protein
MIIQQYVNGFLSDLRSVTYCSITKSDQAPRRSSGTPAPERSAEPSEKTLTTPGRHEYEGEEILRGGTQPVIKLEDRRVLASEGNAMVAKAQKELRTRAGPGGSDGGRTRAPGERGRRRCGGGGSCGPTRVG